MHRCLTVSVSLLRMWVHCSRASNGLLPRRSNLVGYLRLDAPSDRFPPCQTIIPTAFRSQYGLLVIRTQLFATDPNASAFIRSLCDIIGKIPSMARKGISGGALHKVPPDLRRALSSDSAARAAWEDITPLARN